MAAKISEDEKRTYLAVSRALWRMDKADPASAAALGDTVWSDAKPDYVKRARKLIRAFERENITLFLPESALAEGE